MCYPRAAEVHAHDTDGHPQDEDEVDVVPSLYPRLPRNSAPKDLEEVTGKYSLPP